MGRVTAVNPPVRTYVTLSPFFGHSRSTTLPTFLPSVCAPWQLPVVGCWLSGVGSVRCRRLSTTQNASVQSLFTASEQFDLIPLKKLL